MTNVTDFVTSNNNTFTTQVVKVPVKRDCSTLLEYPV